MTQRREKALTRRDLILRSSIAAGAILTPHSTEAREHNAAIGAVLDGADAPLPKEVRAVWDLKQAHTEQTPTRGRISLNGLWRWQPAAEGADTVPVGSWGFFKAPGCWPGITDYLQKDCQIVYAHPSWEKQRLGGVTAAWYQREITVPGDWTGRRIAITTEYLNSLATVFVDGKKAGEIHFPEGEVDLTALCRPGATHLLSILVTALPLKAVMLSYTDTNAARLVKGTVERRGLCGDVSLVGRPQAAQIQEVKLASSVHTGEMTVDTALTGLAAGVSYRLRVQVRDKERIVHEFTSPPFHAEDLHNGRFVCTEKWKPAKLWDVHTPQNMHTVQVSLVEAGGKLVDAALPERFGFREFTIKGRDFYLNGSRIYLSALPFDNAQVGVAWASYEGAKETMERLKSYGVNFVYTHNYSCEPGVHLSFAEILRAADDVGMLVALAQPHFSNYDWKAPDADANNGYARHAAFYVRVGQNHPSVVAYGMSHNATGYVEEANPDMIDGIQDPREDWGRKNSLLALRAEAIVKHLDSSRIVYHHSSGNLGSMHTCNFYVNLVPPQELSDWFEHWATKGVKPLFLCEYGVPCTWDWTLYRGWYQGKREWGSALVPWEFCLAEWNAQFLGDKAYDITEREKTNLRWEAAQFRAGKLWHRWDYPTDVGSGAFDERNSVFSDYITDNWRAYRTWGVSAYGPWEHEIYWTLRANADRTRKALPQDWDHLQKPGFSADYREDQPSDMVLGYERADWIPTAAGRATIRNNGPLLAYISGKPARFTSKDHNFLPGEKVEKQLILINNSRLPVTCDCSWSLALPTPVKGSAQITIPTGEQVRVLLPLPLPNDLTAGKYELTASVKFSKGEPQNDSFTLHVLPPPPTIRASAKLALFDPKGETAALLNKMGVKFAPVEAQSNLASYETLIIGKGAFTLSNAAPDIAQRVRDGLKVLVLEQTAEVLEQRFGFRVAEYGLRQVFRRVEDHPVLTGLEAVHLQDWCGEATILPSRLKYTVGDRYSPQVKWCGMDVTRVWRCGCQGNVASVLIEKPACGDFLPILEGGFSLQYSPLLEYREGQGMALFCQMDVTGRTEADPAADHLLRNIVSFVSTWKPSVRRPAIYVGDPAGAAHLKAAGFAPTAYTPGKIPAEAVLIVGPGGMESLSGQEAVLHDWLKAGGRTLAIGLNKAEIGLLAPGVQVTNREHIAAYFDSPPVASPFAGIGPADIHNRDPRVLPLVTGGASLLGNGVLALAGDTVLSALVPWQFDPKKQMNLKRTFRHTAYVTARLASNMGATSTTPLLGRFSAPVDAAKMERRWLDGLYLDIPEEWDDPYRFFGW